MFIQIQPTVGHYVSAHSNELGLEGVVLTLLHASVLARAVDLAQLRPNARIVDVACGPGTLALMAARRVAHVDALDFAPDMVKQLEARAAAAKIGNVTARVGDGEALPYPERSFDGAFSMFG